MTERELLQAAVSLEAKSEHPLAAAIMKRGEEEKLQPEAAENFAAITGSGLTATVLGAQLLGGSVKYMASQLALPQEIHKQADALSQSGKTPLLFAKTADFSASSPWRTPSSRKARRPSGSCAAWASAS